MSKILIAFLLSILITINLQAQKYEGAPKEIEQILKNIESFSQSYMSANYEKMAASYTEDGKIFPDKTDIIEGREKIQKRWTLPKEVKILKHKVSPEEIKIIGDHAYDYGYYEGTTQKADGSKVDWKGKYVIVWKKVEGDWKIYLDIWNQIN